MKRAFLVAALLSGLASAAAAQAPAGPAAPPVFAQCRACHQVGESARNAVGPHLNGLFGRRAGSVPGFNYSPVYRAPPTSEKVWDEDNFRAYIRNPREVTPGTRMLYAGLRDEALIDQLVAYLRTFDENGRRVAPQ
jgi:cytochrome c